MNVLKNIAIGKPSKPSLILDYKNNTYRELNSSNILLPTTFNAVHYFSRVGGGGRFKENGLFEWQSSGPLFDYDPVSLEAIGLLIEGQATNEVRFSEQINNWTLSRVSVSSDVSASPAGTLTTDRLLSNTESGQHFADNYYLNNSAGIYQLSVFFKPKISDTLVVGHVVVGPSGGVSYLLISFNSLGSPSWSKQLSSGFWIDSTIRIELVANGFYRLTALYEIPSSATVTSHRMRILPKTAISGVENTSIYADYWGASCVKLNSSLIRSSYIPTTISTVTRSADYADLLFNPAIKTIIVDHDVASGLPLLATGSNDLLTSNGAGRSILAIDDTNVYTSHNGSSYVSATKPTFDSTLKLLRNGADTIWANGHLGKLIAFPRKLSIEEAMAA